MKWTAPLLLAAASLAVAESVIDFTKLPACAQQQCTILKQADDNCVPPSAPKTEQAIYQSCICQSGLLTGLHSSGQLCQTAGCSADDATKISQYYIALCAGPVVQPATPTTATTLTTTTTTSAPTSTVAVSATDPGGFNTPKEPWIKNNWKWVVMVVVIAVAIVFFWVGGIYLRRHFDRKKDAERANLAAKEGGGSGSGTPAMASTSNTAMPLAFPEMSGGRNGSNHRLSGPTPPPAAMSRRLSRSNTLGSMKSRTSVASPIVWGPHQHLANSNGRNTPVASGPPSPSSAIGPPQPFRNRDSFRSSNPRINSWKSQEFSAAAGYADSPRASRTSHGPEPTTINHDQSTERPHTAFGDPIRETNRRTLAPTHSDTKLPSHAEGQSAEICEVSPPRSPAK
ncbi:hypothetical protein BU24DRAFT_241504 [Aaosphaeria arxii CBS 175.79]|uniref:Extracellular membrane protein CFEM domain-containing protein n=1 Tax=Aaosphaeria arxii CBS 175.79 TaxID=1450172 RepID=A0A6A5XMQ3_9PLEO|nr:uncharacterized protein BU24DRAFT_241504 [Aaosphaeria arxii CBS 175.79]KAF2013614.1 hypothetical protein BU24DRAFT_241504 [Aaosphaeria arxii CBS 175.79]